MTLEKRIDAIGNFKNITRRAIAKVTLGAFLSAAAIIPRGLFCVRRIIDSRTYITGWTGNQGNKRKLKDL
ncbi:unnamed protein product [marine sediment metagenome]|uniref:Uncharacterized protein n=1 Tax=marine sediment metagenome TaxID=412755 RepID=X1B3L1_9ZZZZ